MHFFITGATGLIGSKLIPHLTENHRVTALTRNIAMAHHVLSRKVNMITSMDRLENFDDIDVIINLAGEPIADKRWTQSRKTDIQNSRWKLTQAIVDKIKASSAPPRQFISGSAVGYYGRQGEQFIDENYDQVYPEFSHELCAKWEKIANKAASDKTRVCTLRTGIVLSRRGGALEKMTAPFRMGLGSTIAGGSQYMSWIHIEDMIAGILHLVSNTQSHGPYNFTSPNPVTNTEFSQTLAEQFNRNCRFNTPAWVIKLMFGEMADLLIYGQRVMPKKLLDEGFEFAYPHLNKALAQLDP